jgi:hypothetical protein
MRRRARSLRGRPKDIQYSRFDVRIIEYLAELSMKHRINKTELFSAIVDAWQNGKTTCQGLTIKLRMKKEDRVIMLITQNNMVVAQFSIHKHILEETNPFRVFDYLSN